MKIRNGFVSNSSSSSFVCDICCGAEGGWDLSLRDAGMVSCANGHYFHEDCLSKDAFNKIKLQQEEEIEVDGEWVSNPDFNDDYPYEIEEAFCPLCTLDALSLHDAKKILNIRVGNDEVILDTIKKLGYKTMNEYLEGEKQFN